MSATWIEGSGGLFLFMLSLNRQSAVSVITEERSWLI